MMAKVKLLVDKLIGTAQANMIIVLMLILILILPETAQIMAGLMLLIIFLPSILEVVKP